MLGLRPYKPCDAQAIASWIKSEAALRQWSADRYGPYPILAEDINAYYDKERMRGDCWAMTACEGDDVVGHFAMRRPEGGRGEIRLGFVIVDDARRRKGIGREMLSLAVRYAFDFLHAERITLGVFEKNLPARAFYRACGFKEVPQEEAETYRCMGESWACVQMELPRAGRNEGGCDMIASLTSLPPYRLSEKYKMKRAFHGDKSCILQFIRENFSEGWACEAESAVMQVPSTLFLVTENGRIVGFACYDASAKGFFGPIGVLEEKRGQGIGEALLIRTLEAMREAGYGYAVIGWVDDAEGFYRKIVGAEFISGGQPERSVYANMVCR